MSYPPIQLIDDSEFDQATNLSDNYVGKGLISLVNPYMYVRDTLGATA